MGRIFSPAKEIVPTSSHKLGQCFPNLPHHKNPPNVLSKIQILQRLPSPPSDSVDIASAGRGNLVGIFFNRCPPKDYYDLESLRIADKTCFLDS